MAYPLTYSSNSRKSLSKLNLIIITLIIVSYLLLIQCSDEPPKIINNIIIFEHTKYSGGAIDKDGDLFIEYYSDEKNNDIPKSILFYGLSKNDRYCFSNESSYTKEENIDIDEIIDIEGYYNYYKIYDSKNLFVTIKNDVNRENQYLFSINSYNSIVELHNFNDNTDKSRYIWDFKDFFNLREDEYNFPYQRE